MAQPVDPDQIITNAADAIVSGGTLDPAALKLAAGWATRQAADGDCRDVLRLIVLVAADQFKAAQHLLVDMSFGDEGGAAGATATVDPLDGMLSGAATQSATTARPTPPPGRSAASSNTAQQSGGGQGAGGSGRQRRGKS